MNLLDTILAHKRQEVEARKKECPRERLRDMPLFRRSTFSLQDRLAGSGITVIAELKKASPSRGVIRESFDAVAIARAYVRGGASALSVLTDGRFFHGSLSILSSVRNIVSVPLLRKDFIVDSYQLSETKAYGADAVLLIAAALPPPQLRDLHEEALGLGLECLVEVHTEAEIASLDGIGCKLIGINNRDLTTFTTDLSVSLRLRPLIAHDVVVVSESGIACAADLRRLRAAGIHAVLIGEAFMREERPGDALAELLKDAGDSAA
jgi:indole-3-glycerol phosphate synthase